MLIKQKKDRADLDGGHIDFHDQVQISNHSPSKPVVIKRMSEMSNKYIRSERFRVDPSEFTAKPFSRNFHTFYQVAQAEKIPKGDMIDRTARGHEEGGARIGKKKEAQVISNLFREMQGKDEKQICECCLLLYTMESFLYQLLNKAMREAEIDEEPPYSLTSEDDRIPDDNLGPYRELLTNYLVHHGTRVLNTVLYRSATMCEE